MNVQGNVCGPGARRGLRSYVPALLSCLFLGLGQESHPPQGQTLRVVCYLDQAPIFVLGSRAWSVIHPPPAGPAQYITAVASPLKKSLPQLLTGRLFKNLSPS